MAKGKAMGRLWGVLALAVAAFGGADAGDAQQAPVVIELYTSQGCSSCPPADRLLGELAGRDDVIPLALHVDYWDYIGWKDIYGKSAYTQRQKGYARAAGHRTIYTPQMIVGGADHVVGYKPMKLADLITAHRDRAAGVTVTAIRTGDRVEIRAEVVAGPPAETLVQLVRYIPSATVEIRRGENAGKTYTYHNIVTDWRMVGGWDMSGPLRIEAEVDGDAPAVVILQKPGHGPILAAARVE